MQAVKAASAESLVQDWAGQMSLRQKGRLDQAEKSGVQGKSHQAGRAGHKPCPMADTNQRHKGKDKAGAKKDRRMRRQQGAWPRQKREAQKPLFLC